MKLEPEYRLTLDPLTNCYELVRQFDRKKIKLEPNTGCYNATVCTVEYINRLREQGHWVLSGDVFNFYASRVFGVSGVDDND